MQKAGHEASPFERAGLAAVSDLATPEWQCVLRCLEREQEAFLANEALFRSPEYRWPRDPLHCWSRVWEYPYAYHHLQSWRESSIQKGLLHAADIGSGVTFFPFAAAKLGYTVTCVDVDAVCKRDIENAARCVPHAPGAVQFKLSEAGTIPLQDEECDVVFCISVLEHVSTPDQTVAEIARVLKPGGLFLVTIDLDLRGDGAIGPVAHRRLMAALQRSFRPFSPQTAIHPADMLTSTNSPYPLSSLGLSRLPFALWRGRKARHPGGLKCPLLVPNYLAVEGETWIKEMPQ